ncbi:MAG: hypothetical protein ACSLE3_15690 [Microbacteriaceae bacterium]
MDINDHVLYLWTIGGFWCLWQYWWLLRDSYDDLEISRRRDQGALDPELSEDVVRQRLHFYWMIFIVAAVITSIGVMTLLRQVPLPDLLDRALNSALMYYGRWALLSIVYFLIYAGAQSMRGKKRNLRPQDKTTSDQLR